MNPRFLAYARAHDLDPDEMLALDAERYPGGKMAGFIVWIGERWRAWASAVGRRNLEMLSDADHAAFDEWLGATG